MLKLIMLDKWLKQKAFLISKSIQGICLILRFKQKIEVRLRLELL